MIVFTAEATAPLVPTPERAWMALPECNAAILDFTAVDSRPDRLATAEGIATRTINPETMGKPRNLANETILHPNPDVAEVPTSNPVHGPRS